MTSSSRFGWARLPVLAAGLSMAMALAAAAQTPPAKDDTEDATEEAQPSGNQVQPSGNQVQPWGDQAQPSGEQTPAADANDADLPKDIDESKIDWSQLNSDASTLPTLATRRATKPSGAGGDPSWSSSLNGNGTSGVSVKQQVSPFLDTNVGADMTVARQGTTTAEQLSERLANGGSLPQSGGSAWASVSAPGVASVWDKTSVEARLDPGADQSKIGTSMSKQMPLSEQYSVTLQNGINMTQQGVVQVPGIISRPSRSYDTEQSAKLSVNDSGTSIVAGQTSSFDDKWLRRIGAEQKLFDGVTVSGSVGETAQGTTTKSITAGFKRTW